MDVDFRTYLKNYPSRARQMGTGSILVNLSGRGDKDLDYVIQNYGYGEKYKDFRF